MRVLVLGAYGLIGQGIVRELLARGDHVVGVARNVERGRQLMAEVSWVPGDLNYLLHAKDWEPLLVDIDAVVNASGALQSGLKDNLAAVQRDSIVALVAACQRAKVRGFVQVSAPGAGEQAVTEFLRTKGQADAALRASDLDWVILKPGLVVSQTAYGGTESITDACRISVGAAYRAAGSAFVDDRCQRCRARCRAGRRRSKAGAPGV